LGGGFLVCRVGKFTDGGLKKEIDRNTLLSLAI
jgi:hypothetical protein